jgi:hypothetical protein
MVALPVAAPLPALAASFDFSYTFSSGSVMEGSFDGNISLSDPNLIENIHGITASFHGATFSVALGGDTAVGPTPGYDVVTFDGAGLNFRAAWPGGGFGIDETSAAIHYFDGTFLYFDTDLALLIFPPPPSSFILGRWMVAENTSGPVPEPTGSILFSAGFVMVGCALRRRTKARG